MQSCHCLVFRVCDKFRIHSDVKRAKKLQELSEKFLESPVFEQKNVGKVHFCASLPKTLLFKEIKICVKLSFHFSV